MVRLPSPKPMELVMMMGPDTESSNYGGNSSSAASGTHFHPCLLDRAPWQLQQQNYKKSFLKFMYRGCIIQTSQVHFYPKSVTVPAAVMLTRLSVSKIYFDQN